MAVLIQVHHTEQMFKSQAGSLSRECMGVYGVYSFAFGETSEVNSGRPAKRVGCGLRAEQ